MYLGRELVNLHDIIVYDKPRYGMNYMIDHKVPLLPPPPETFIVKRCSSSPRRVKHVVKLPIITREEQNDAYISHAFQ